MDLTIKALNWTSPGRHHLVAIRQRVFVDEQGVSEAEEWDGMDASAQHFIVTAPEQGAIGCARVLHPSTGAHSYQIGRVAIISDFRGQGIGARLMSEVIHWCLEDAFPTPTRITLSAQVERLRFYRRLGFVPKGSIFLDAGMPHQRMKLDPAKHWRYV